MRSTAFVRILGALAVTAGSAAIVASIGAGVSSAAVVGSLAISPGTGTSSSAIDVTTSAGCPSGGTNIVVNLFGAGFPASGFTVVGNTDAGVSNSNGFRVSISDTLQSFASQQSPPATLSGKYDFVLTCQSRFGDSKVGDFVGSVTFSNPTNYTASSASTSPSATASPAASTSPSASPSTSTSPSTPASPSPSASPTAGRVPAQVVLTSSHPRITAGNTPVLSGQVFDSAGAPLAGVSLAFSEKSFGETAFSATDSGSVTSGADGRFSLAVRPINQTTYGANTVDGRARSNTVQIRVNARMDITSPAAGARVSNPVTLSGRLLPAYDGRPIGLAYIDPAGRYVYLGQGISANGAWTVRAGSRVPAGTYTFVVYMSPTQGTDKGARSVRLTV